MNRFFAILVSLLFAISAYGESAKDARVPIRSNFSKCEILLSLQGSSNADSVALPLTTSLAAEEFSKGLERFVAENGLSALRGAQFYIKGAQISEEGSLREKLETTFERMGLSRDDVKFHILSIPDQEIRRSLPGVTKAVWQRILYFLPSLKRDLEKPLSAEVNTALISTAAIEIPNITYLYMNLPILDATATATTHAAILVALCVYTKTVTNWILRNPKNLDIFLKQLLFSGVFVANYNIFGNLTPLLEFIKLNGIDAAWARFPYEMAQFASEQGLTSFLQVAFYSLIITKGIRGWVQQQTDPQNYQDARVVSNMVAFPLLTADSIALATAATASTSPMMDLGFMAINSGHVALGGLIISGSILYFWPHVLDPTIKWYRKIRSCLGCEGKK